MGQGDKLDLPVGRLAKIVYKEDQKENCRRVQSFSVIPVSCFISQAEVEV